MRSPGEESDDRARGDGGDDDDDDHSRGHGHEDPEVAIDEADLVTGWVVIRMRPQPEINKTRCKFDR
jgi:hypothetical protein